MSTASVDHKIFTTSVKPIDGEKVVEKKVELVRKRIEPDVGIVELGLACNLEEIAENLRRWFSQKIIRPLKEDIDAVTTTFLRAGLDHLSPQSPASFSLFPRTAPTTSGEVIMLTASNFVAAAKPQTLLELCQKYPTDPIVQSRLRLERYLSFASLQSHRAAVVRRIIEMSEDGLVGAFRWSPALLGIPSATSAEPSNEDSQILMHLFCAFMDEHLPSEEYYESQPFSAKHFVAFEETPSKRPDAIQIQQLQRQPPYFRLIAESNIYEIYPGAHNIFYVLVFMVEYLHRYQNGFLGVGNLASPAIDLISILNIPY